MVCDVVTNEPAAIDYRHLVLAVPATALGARAGQFFHLLCPVVGADSPFLRRPMSVFGVRRPDETIEFLYKVSGVGTRALAGLGPGDTLNIFGPLGNGFFLDEQWRHLLVVGRGVGLATLAPLVADAREAGIASTAVLSARTPEHLMAVEHFERYSDAVYTVTDSDGNSDVSQMEALLREIISSRRIKLLATCGSNRLLLLLQRLGAELDIPGQVALEQNMGCALGMCFCCVRPFRSSSGTAHMRVCSEGPVFDIQETLSW